MTTSTEHEPHSACQRKWPSNTGRVAGTPAELNRVGEKQMKFQKIRKDLIHVKELTPNNGHNVTKMGSLFVSQKQVDGMCRGEVLALGEHASTELGIGDTVHWKRDFGIPICPGEILLPLEHAMLEGSTEVFSAR